MVDFTFVSYTLTILSTLVAAAPLTSRNNGAAAAPESHRVVAYNSYYRDNGNDGPPTKLLPIIEEDSRITHLILFVSDLHKDEPHFTIGGPAPDNTTFLGPLWDEVAEIQSKGVKVLASLGGAFAESFLYLEEDFEMWYPYIYDFLTTYNLDGYDLDIEPGPPPEDATVNGTSSVVKLIKRLKQDMKPGFLVTMAPVARDLTSSPAGFSGFDYKQLDDEARDEDGNPLVDWYNGQFYNGWGNCDSTDTYDQVVEAGWDPARVVMGVITATSQGNGFCDIATLESTVSALSAKYPNFGGFDGYDWVRAGDDDDIERWQWFQRLGGAEGVESNPA